MAGRSSEYTSAQDVAASQSGNAVGGGCAECHTGNWIHVRYEYTEGDPITDAVYVVQTPNGGEPGGTVIAEGVISIGPDAEHEYVHVDLGDHAGEVEVFVFDDPTEPVPFEEPQPVEDQRNWLQRAADSVMNGAEWTWDVAQGDFNEDMSTGQIITNAVVTAVPIVDQVADARDLVANGKALIWDRRYAEIGVWVGVFACLIGLVPSLGSLAKGVIKLVWRNAGEVGKILIYINKALHRTGMRVNGYRFVKKLADDVIAQVGFVTRKFNEFLDACLQRIPRWTGDGLRETIEHVRGMATQMFPRVAQEIRERLLRGLADFASRAWRVMPGQGIVIRRATRAVIDAGPFTSFQRRMARDGFDEDALTNGARSISPQDKLRMQQIRIDAMRWKDELLNDPNFPDSLRQAAQHDPARFVNELATFGSKPSFVDFTQGGTERMYRVVGDESQIGGSFWSRSPPPSDEMAWRTRDAVSNDWNRGGGYMVADVPPPPAALVGEIGPQDLGDATKHRVPHDGQMLEGGGEQLWFPRTAYPEPAIPSSQVKEYHYTDWNAPTQASRATVRAGRIGDCDL
ncbi:hypothetical protein [Litoreibacter arenae]|uniref:Uncharacterized protein n=1 Tax=Litoreibacter arenae DSM 19593 TaxID=1123360 RepID=S9QFP7_9RHOB|nr:hypothetical protein [Litoreibacter arenae]EPX80266.1 hypothetical protein thalar_01606 [Litoreibacter arenae DSM 19593]